jgi:hypothetical protein
MSDRLDRALQLLRDAERGRSPRADETLGRVLRDVGATRGRRLKRVRVWVPIAAVLALSTGAFAASGRLGTLRAFFGEHRDVPGSAPRLSPTGVSSSAARTSEPLADTAATAPSPAASVVTPELASASGSDDAFAPAVPRRAIRAPSPQVAAPSPSQAIASSPGAPVASERPAGAQDASPSALKVPALADEDAYARAHQIHFGNHDPGAALAAWAEYLRLFPDGRFVPEARYNEAIDLLKLRRYPEARAALQSFANGTYGAYHRDDARALLRSIR